MGSLQFPLNVMNLSLLPAMLITLECKQPYDFKLCLMLVNLKCLRLQDRHHIMYNFCGLNLTFSKMTNIQVWLFVGSGIGFQTAYTISSERTVYKIKNKMHNWNDLSFGCLILYKQRRCSVGNTLLFNIIILKDFFFLHLA